MLAALESLRGPQLQGQKGSRPLSASPLTVSEDTGETYLAVVSVEAPQLADIAQGDPLRQRLRTHVRRREGGQAVRRVCEQRRWKPAFKVLHLNTSRDKRGRAGRGGLGPAGGAA